MPPRKRRARRRLRPKVTVWLIVAANVLLAFYASRLTAIRSVEVVGARPYDRARLSAIAARLQGTPDARVNHDAVETEVLREPSVRAVSMSTNHMGKATIHVVYRRPVASLTAVPGLAMDEEGVVYFAPDLPEGLTPLDLPGGVPATLLGVMSDWPAKRIATLAVDVRTLGIPEGVGIQMDQQGAICLNVGTGRVILGSCDDLDAKLKALRLRLQLNRDDLSRFEELNLTRPESPAVVKRKVLRGKRDRQVATQ